MSLRKRFAWAPVVLAAGLSACTQLPFINGAASNTLSPSATPSRKPNQEPIIKSLTAHRFEDSQDRVTLWVQAYDPECEHLKFSWSATEGLLSTTVGTNVTLTSLATKSVDFVSTVLVSVSDGKGGTVQGSLNVQFTAEGVPLMMVEATKSQPTPEPCSTPTPEPTPASSTGAPYPTPTPSSGIPITQQGYATVSGVAYYKKYDGYTFLGNFAIANTKLIFAEHSFSGGSTNPVTVTTASDGQYSIRLKTHQEYEVGGEKGARGEIPAKILYITPTKDTTLNIEYWAFD
ncbi:hypothetical protein D3C72_132320 [compost metagenome]